MSSVTARHLLALLDRPQEPVFYNGGDRELVFSVPSKYLPDRYSNIGNQVLNRFGDAEVVEINEISLPDITLPMQIDREDNFSLFVPHHRDCATHLIDLFMAMRNTEELTSLAVYCRDRVNPYLFNYCLSVALLHRPDTQGIQLTSLAQVFPDKYIDSRTFSRAREMVHVVPKEVRAPIEIPRDYTASDLDPEHRVAYFREDMGVNLHHWHWHLVYPFQAGQNNSIVRKDRRGELFYYMHEQVIARYNFERLCNNLARVVRFIDWREPITEAYFPKLDSLVASRGWPARMSNTRLSNVHRESDRIELDIQDLERWRTRIYDAIHSGFVIGTKGEQIPLGEFEGIDILGNIVESSVISVNRELYGDLHNMMHTFISYIHDPDNRNLEPFGVMGDSATAMRDPIFYRWHATLDELFQEHKATLPKYNNGQLNYPGVVVKSVTVRNEDGRANQFCTFWQQSDIDFSRGMDFTPRGSVYARVTHLQHEPFKFELQIDNRNREMKKGTCRIFLSPKYNEQGNSWRFNEQRLMMIELDKFVVNLRPGPNTITRNSVQSSVTIPFERVFRNLDKNRPQGGQALAQFNFCGCGWPDYMLIPKGTAEGMPCELFVMISNYFLDEVKQDTSGECNDAASYCGLYNKLYPDRRSMGFPFDRLAPSGVGVLSQFLTQNMFVQDVTVKFTDKVLVRYQQQNNDYN